MKANKKDVSSIARSAARSDNQGQYLFDNNQILLPIGIDATLEPELSLWCLGAVYSQTFIVLYAIGVALLVRAAYVYRKRVGSIERVDRDKFLHELALDYASLFGDGCIAEDVSRLMLEDIGLSESFGILYEEDG